ncbi:MAG: ADP-glyceromanno-heptose 6-epimerase, partial [Leptospiraceae bacterium]|nr:ADP-glyceromanno-heptose 6-epimerase [Leptospiraceae bacterium]
GLIGSAVVRELNLQGRRDLILVDHLGQSDKWHNLRSLLYAEYVEKDAFRSVMQSVCAQGRSAADVHAITPPGAITPAILEQIDTIIHLGANSATTEKDASHLIDNNYRYSIEVARLATVLNARLVYASSAATYGDGSHGFVDRFDDYLDQLRPLNAYGYSKHAFDLYMRDQFQGPAFAGLKYFNVYGPNEYHKGDMRSVVHKAFEQIESNGRLALFKSYRPDYQDGEQKRDFLYVADAARMTVHLALQNRSARGLFNLGSGQAHTWLELAAAIFASMSRPVEVDFIEMPAALRSKYQYYTCAPVESLRSAGFNATITPLNAAVEDYIRNYLLQEQPYA